MKSSMNSYLKVLKICPESLFSGIHLKFRVTPNFSSGKKKISGVSKIESPKIGSTSAEPLTVPPSPGHNTQLGTSEKPCACTKLLRSKKQKKVKSFIVKNNNICCFDVQEEFLIYHNQTLMVNYER